MYGSTYELKSPSRSRVADLVGGRSLKSLLELVEIDSPTRNIEGVFAVQKWVARELHSLGFSTQFFMHEKSEFAPLMLGFFKGLGQKTISLVMHADTVLDSQQYGSGIMNIDRGRLYGPGVIDNKGGIIIALEGLRSFLNHCKPFYNIQLVCVPNEELGSDGFRDHLAIFGKKSDMILGFEPAMNEGDIIHSRNGNRWYDITIRGIEAHSGRCYGEEINAAHELAMKLVKILELKKIYKNIKLNVGSLQSSKDKYNVVCGEVSMKLDLRFECNEIRDEVHQKIAKILQENMIINNDNEVSTTEHSIVDDCPAFLEKKNSQPYISLLKKLIQYQENTSPRALNSGGASDVNYMSHNQAVCIDGLGAVGGQMHTDQEFIQISSLKTRSRVLYHFLRVINNPLLEVRGGFDGHANG